MTNEKTPWKGKTGGGNFGQKSLIFLFKFCNVRIGYFFAAFAIPFYMITDPAAFKAIFDLFRKRLEFGRSKSFFYTMKNYYRFAQIIVDRFSVLAKGRSEFIVTIAGNDYFAEFFNGENAFLIASSHVGNFEIIGYLLQQNLKKINSLIYGGEAPVFQKYRKKQMNENNINLIPVEKDLSHLFALNQAIDNGEVVTVPCDRRLGSNKVHKTDFLGQMASFPLGAFMIAACKNIPVLSVFVIKKSASHYHIFIQPVTEETQEHAHPAIKATKMAESFVRQLEDVVKKHPDQWFNYYDFWNN